MTDQNAGSEANPLFVHAIILFLVAAIIVGVGGKNLVESLGAKAKQSTSGQGAQSTISDIQRKQSEARYATTDAERMTRAPTSLSDLSSQIQSGTRLMKQFKDYVLPNLLIIWGLLVGATGYYILQQANWARMGGFVGVAGTLLYFTIVGIAAPLAHQEPAVDAATGQPAMNADGTPIMAFVDFEVWRPIVLIIIAGFAGKILWDLAVEKFAPPPAPAA